MITGETNRVISLVTPQFSASSLHASGPDGGHGASKYTASRVSKSAALQMLKVVSPVREGVYRNQVSSSNVTPPAPPSQNTGSPSVVAPIVVIGKDPSPTASGELHESLVGGGVPPTKMSSMYHSSVELLTLVLKRSLNSLWNTEKPSPSRLIVCSVNSVSVVPSEVIVISSSHNWPDQYSTMSCSPASTPWASVENWTKNASSSWPNRLMKFVRISLNW